MMAPKALSEGLTAHLAVSLGVDSNSVEEMDGVGQIAQAALDYFSGNVAGAPVASASGLLWAIFSGLLAGSAEQERIDAFFSDVSLDFPDLIRHWPGGSRATLAILPAVINPRYLQNAVDSMTPEQLKRGVTVALIPGVLTEADISDVVQSLYKSHRSIAGIPTPPKTQPEPSHDPA